MNSLITVAALVASFALQAGPSAETAAPAQPPAPQDFATAVRAGKAALDAGDADGAITAYEAAKSARPDSAEAAYNLGVALYRGGKFREAAAAFKKSADLASSGERTDPALNSASLFNKAASFYGATRDQAAAAQQVLEKAAAGDQAGAAPPVDPKALEQAITDAKESLRSFKDAAFADETDLGSRANAEQASRLVRALEELQRQQQQQQQQQQDDQQKQDQQNKDQDQNQDQSEDQKNEDQQNQDNQQSDDQQKPKDGEQDKKDQKQQPGADEQKPQEQQQKDQQQKDQPQQDQGDDKQDDSKSDAQPKPNDGNMTKDEADRLLQAVRDREQKRRAEQERRAEQQAKNARGRKPIKDW